MEFIYDGNPYTIPDDLSEITLEQHINYMAVHGTNFRIKTRNLDQIVDPGERHLEAALIYMDRMVTVLSYYSGIPLEEVRDNIDIKQVLSYVGATQLALAVQERELEVVPGATYDFDGHPWTIQPPTALPEVVTYDHYMATNELARLMLELAAGNWEVMPSICAAYLRLPGEDFNPNGWQVGTTREVLMRTLPLDIALRVGYYLQASLELFVTVLEDYTAEIPEP